MDLLQELRKHAGMSGYNLSVWTVKSLCTVTLQPVFEVINDCMNKVSFVMVVFLFCLPAYLKLSLTVFKVLHSFLAALSDPGASGMDTPGIEFYRWLVWYKNRKCFYILVLRNHGNIHLNDHQSCVKQSWLIGSVYLPSIISHLPPNGLCCSGSVRDIEC